MIKYSVVLVPFPFDDLSDSKVRPALCLTSGIGSLNHVVIAFITSKIPDILTEYDLVIRKDSNNWQGTGLTANSVIRLNKMVTIPKSLIKRKLGRINSETASVVLRKLKQLFEKE